MEAPGRKRTQEQLKNQYRDSSNLDARVRLHQLYSINTYGWYNWYIDQLDLPAHCRMLELGCGPGSVWKQHLDRFPSGWTLVMSDFSQGMAKKAADQLSSEGAEQEGKLLFSVADAQTIPFPDEYFDVVFANHMLYHVPDLGKALAEIRRVLKPGGKLYAATNGENHMAELDELVIRVSPELKDTLLNMRQWAWASPFSLEQGEALLSPYFSSIERRRYEDGLRVTDAQALVDYLLSMASFKTFSQSMGEQAQARIEQFTRMVEEEIRTKGSIDIRKEAGLFIAQK